MIDMMGSISSTRAKGPCFSSPAKIPKVKFKTILITKMAAPIKA